jgi:hypothetical protein
MSNKHMKITTSSGKMFSAEEVEAQKQALLREVLGKKLWVDLADDKKRNKTKWRLEAVPVEAIQALMEGKK